MKKPGFLPKNGYLILSIKKVNGFKYTKFWYCPKESFSQIIGVSNIPTLIIDVQNGIRSLNLADKEAIKILIQK